MEGKKVLLSPLTSSNIKRTHTEKLLYRHGGIRMDHELINGKHIMHNYGCGGANISLSYGAAYLSAKALSIHVEPSEPVVVLGGGISGLMTAIELNKRGRQVTLYTEHVGNTTYNVDANGSNKPCPTVWMPNEYDWSADLLRHEFLCKLAFQYFNDCVSEYRYQSMRTVEAMDVGHTAEDLKEAVGGINFGSIKQFQGQIEGKEQSLARYNTILIDTAFFQEQLRIEALLRGVKVVQRKIKTLNEVLELKESGVVNCLGAGSLEIFEDKAAYVVERRVIEFNEDSKQLNNLALKGIRRDKAELELYRFGGKTYLVGQKETPLSERELLQQMQAYQQTAPRPRL